MRKTLLFFALALAMLAGCVFWLRQVQAPSGPTRLKMNESATSVGPLPSSEALVAVLPATETASGTTQAPAAEEVSASTIGYLPPASKNLSGASLGRQRVPLPDTIGDVHQLYYDTSLLTLFMAVTEPDGQRSIWKLPENGKAERVFTASGGSGVIGIMADSQGVIYVQHDHPDRLYRSDDGLKTWRLVLRDYGTFWSIADDGKGNVYGTTHDWNRAVLYRSPNDGYDWEPWIDFQQLFPQYAKTYRDGDDRFLLRHLHGVIYDTHKGQIIVGTGDVARFAFMSPDEGKTWKKVWDEGFTASVAMSGGSRWLLGPDQLHGHGLAIYDAETQTTKEVWNPIPYNYAGYAYSLLNVNGIYYAAFHTEANEVDAVVPKFGVIASPDGQTWYPFLEWGPLGSHARTDVYLAAAPTYIYASLNGALYAFRPLEADWFKTQTPFH